MERRGFLGAALTLPALGAPALAAQARAEEGAIPLLETYLANTERFPDAPALRPGETLVVRRDPDRAFDPRAVLVTTADGAGLGYVPPLSAGTLAALLDAGSKARATAMAAPAGRIEVRIDLLA